MLAWLVKEIYRSMEQTCATPRVLCTTCFCQVLRANLGNSLLGLEHGSFRNLSESMLPGHFQKYLSYFNQSSLIKRHLNLENHTVLQVCSYIVFFQLPEQLVY